MSVTKATKPSKLDKLVAADVGALTKHKDLVLDDHLPSTNVPARAIRDALKRDRNMGELDITLVDPHPDNRSFDQDELQHLAESIKLHGVLQPINVRFIEKTGRFQIIAGGRRYAACLIVGLKTIPAVIKEIDDDQTAVQQLVENLQRENLNPIEEAKQFNRYLVATGKSRQELAREIGKDKSYVTRTMALLERLTVEEQAILASVAPVQLPGKSVIYEVLESDDPELRAAVLRGQLSRAQVKDRVVKKRPLSSGRRRSANKVFHIAEPEATVTVRLQSNELDERAIQRALECALEAHSNKAPEEK